MVQRTGLVIALLLAMLAGLLHSQESGFVPPKLVSEAILELPANWKETYSPAEVLIIVEIKADSTATLLKVLDGKNELEAMISDLIPTLVFAPAIRNGEAIDANLTLKLPIIQVTSYRETARSAAADSLKAVDKELLVLGVSRQLERESHQNMSSAGTFYRTNYYLMGLNQDSGLIIKDGFIMPAGLYFNALQYQMLSSFREVDTRYSTPGTVTFNELRTDWPKQREADIIAYTEYQRQYPWSAMCADVYAGLGDYELNFARVQLLKNHLFGVKDFYTEIGFLVQNGWWQETFSDQTSMRLFLTAPFKLIGQNRLSFNFEQYDQDIPSTQLLSGLQSGTPYRAAHKVQDIYLKWALPWFELGWQTGKEKLSAPGTLNRQEYETGQVLLTKDFYALATDFDLSYQYNYKDSNPISQSLYQYNRRPTHQGLLTARHEHNRFYTKDQLLLSEDGLEKINVNLGYRFTPLFSSELIYDFYDGTDSTDAAKGLYADSLQAAYPDVYAMRTFAGKIDWVLSRAIALRFTGGSKIFVTNDFDNISGNRVHDEQSKLFSEIKLSVWKQVFGINASYEQTLLWTQYEKGMYELPELSGQARFKLVREMAYSNALSAGINLTGHTDYTSADALRTPVYGSLVADAWFGVKITDLFEFQLMMKNIGDNIIYGVYPHPRTVLATMHWFFLN